MESNCPKCKVGVLEPLWILSPEHGFVDSESYRLREEEHKEGIVTYVCSKDECGFTELRATPGTLSSAKRKMRQLNHKDKALTGSYPT
ncbi:hypothetical protein [Cytobacillus sp. S13-E01]|uniref:hypothetical protein n=1 Tax=Cytobacillus sp. S13-E01 TaxID=3031326 RepID=UPI0023D7DA9D|nr:hypothetical protein [Cytobacillus sp. S13-E01]